MARRILKRILLLLHLSIFVKIGTDNLGDHEDKKEKDFHTAHKKCF